MKGAILHTIVLLTTFFKFLVHQILLVEVISMRRVYFLLCKRNQRSPLGVSMKRVPSKSILSGVLAHVWIVYLDTMVINIVFMTITTIRFAETNKNDYFILKLFIDFWTIRVKRLQSFFFYLLIIMGLL